MVWPRMLTTSQVFLMRLQCKNGWRSNHWNNYRSSTRIHSRHAS